MEKEQDSFSDIEYNIQFITCIIQAKQHTCFCFFAIFTNTKRDLFLLKGWQNIGLSHCIKSTYLYTLFLWDTQYINAYWNPANGICKTDN